MMTSIGEFFPLLFFCLILLFIPQICFPEEWIQSPQMIFYIYKDSGEELHPNCWVGAGNGDTIHHKENRAYTTFPDGPKYEGTDSMIFEWEHASGWAVFSIAWTWWMHIDISEFLQYTGCLQFMIKGEKGGEDMNVSLNLGEKKSTQQAKMSSYLPNGITTNWQKVRIPLKDFNYDFAMGDNKVQTVSFGIPWITGKFRVYVDNLCYIHTYGADNNKEKIFFDPDKYDGLSLNIENKVDKPGGIIVDKWQLAETLDLSFEKLKDLGVKYIKLDFPWVNIEPKKGIYKFVDYAPIIKKCKENNIEILGCIKDTPFWAKKDNMQNNFIKYPPQQLNDFANFVSHLVTRYKNDITYWEIWENQDNYMSADEYYNLLKYAYAASKMGNPDSVVLSGQIENLEFLNNLPDFKYCDIIGIKIGYPSNNLKKVFSKFNQELEKIIQKKKINNDIWITSIGKVNLRNSGISACEKA